MARGLVVLVLSLSALASCSEKDEVRDRYLEARRKFAAVYARTLSDECREEPDCTEAIQAFATVPIDHPDHADAQQFLERIRVARERRSAVREAVEASKAAPPPVFPSVTGEDPPPAAQGPR